MKLLYKAPLSLGAWEVHLRVSAKISLFQSWSLMWHPFFEASQITEWKIILFQHSTRGQQWFYPGENFLMVKSSFLYNSVMPWKILHWSNQRAAQTGIHSAKAQILSRQRYSLAPNKYWSTAPFSVASLSIPKPFNDLAPPALRLLLCCYSYQIPITGRLRQGGYNAKMGIPTFGET